MNLQSTEGNAQTKLARAIPRETVLNTRSFDAHSIALGMSYKICHNVYLTNNGIETFILLRGIITYRVSS